MKKVILIKLLLLTKIGVFAQEKLVKDIDLDGKKDTVYIDQKASQIVCRLSTQNIKN